MRARVNKRTISAFRKYVKLITSNYKETIEDAIIRIMKQEENEPLTINELGSRIPMRSINSIRSVIYKMVNKYKMKSVGGVPRHFVLIKS